MRIKGQTGISSTQPEPSLPERLPTLKPTFPDFQQPPTQDHYTGKAGSNPPAPIVKLITPPVPPKQTVHLPNGKTMALPPGIDYQFEKLENGGLVHTLSLDLNQDIALTPFIGELNTADNAWKHWTNRIYYVGQNTPEATSIEMAPAFEKQHPDQSVLFALNGSFFGYNGVKLGLASPAGPVVVNGKVVANNSLSYNRANLIIARDTTGQTFAFQLNAPKGTQAQELLNLAKKQAPPGKNVAEIQHILGGAGDLNDRQQLQAKSGQNLAPQSRGIDARTALGISQDGQRLFILVAEGDDRHKSGLSITDIQARLQTQGANQMLLLDGGGSSDIVMMQAGDKRYDGPTQRAVSTGLIISTSRSTPSE